MSVLTAADLRYDPVSHTSTAPDGSAIPHVTAVLYAVGVAKDFETLAGMSGRLALAIKEKRALGTVVHADCHAFDDGDLVWSTLDPRSAPYVEAWSVCRDQLGLVPLTRERRLFHADLRYTGILDGVFRTPNGERVLVDLKLGSPDDAAAHLQTAAYESAYIHEHPTEAISARWAIQLCPGLRQPYRVTNYSARLDAWRDAGIFQACLVVYWAQAGRRRPLR